jgi:hypothetical protein
MRSATKRGAKYKPAYLSAERAKDIGGPGRSRATGGAETHADDLTWPRSAAVQRPTRSGNLSAARDHVLGRFRVRDAASVARRPSVEQGPLPLVPWTADHRHPLAVPIVETKRPASTNIGAIEPPVSGHSWHRELPREHWQWWLTNELRYPNLAYCGVGTARRGSCARMSSETTTGSGRRFGSVAIESSPTRVQAPAGRRRDLSVFRA